MYRGFDRNLDGALDQRATPVLRKSFAVLLAVTVTVLLGWYGADAKTKHDAAQAAKKAMKKKAVATAEK